MDVEAIVVGAGPAGSTAARELAARGVDTLLLDRARFPRDKPCGGGVTVRCDALLPFSLDPVVEDVVHGAVIQLRHGRRVALRHDEPLTYITQRSRLDHFLVERAQEAGAEFRDGQRVRQVTRLGGGGYEVAVGNGAAPELHRARVVIGADGANGVVGSSLGYEHAEESGVGLEGNVPCPDGVPEWLRGNVVLQLGAMTGGYGWLFPKEDHVNVGVGCWKATAGDLRTQLHALCRDYGIDPDRLESLRGHHLPMRRHGSMLAADGSALIGDAAGLIDPLSGEGILAAISSGAAVAPVAHDYLRGEPRLAARLPGGDGARPAAGDRDLEGADGGLLPLPAAVHLGVAAIEPGLEPLRAADPRRRELPRRGAHRRPLPAHRAPPRRPREVDHAEALRASVGGGGSC